MGFVNVAWDGASHAFILDTMVTSRYQRLGIATQMLSVCATEARNRQCEWLHVDFADDLDSSTSTPQGSRRRTPGLIRL